MVDIERAPMSAPFDSPTPGKRSLSSIATETLDKRTVVVVLEGEFDLWSAPQLKRAVCDLLADGRKRLVLDLGAVRFIDSTALGVLVAVDRRLASDQRLVLADPNAEVLRLFELSGLASSFRIFPTRDAAISFVRLDEVQQADSDAPPLTADAALLLGIASTAMPFAQSLEEQAERWLRALRRHGEAGAVLASLGVSEAPATRLGAGGAADALRCDGADPVAIVTEHAGHLAADRGATKLATIDVLRAVVHVYGGTFERVLDAHGVDLDELVARLDPSEPASSESQL